MPSVFVLSNDRQSTDSAMAFTGDELIVLVVIDKGALATSFDSRMDAIERKAMALEHKLASIGKKCRVIVEWGDKNEVVANTLTRERAQLLPS
jgi:hypothetical protein